ncbi:MAG TPA: hypothetical protein VKT81_26260 [Bryobacteraceae bacterium]|nr:hypothetical protein [Bryobacteraceae bacterium]
MLLRFIVISFCLEQTVCIQQACAQTQIDLQAQSKNVDFTTSPTTRPLKSGVSLPATCNLGEMFFLTSTSAGSNLYGCTSPNSWTLESTASGGGSSVQSASQLSDLTPTRNSSTTLLIGSTCALATPCNVRMGSVTYSFTASATATVSAGTGTAFLYIDSSGNLTVGHNLSVSCSSGCAAAAGITAFPSDSIPLFTWTATNGTWDSSGGADRRAFQSATNVSASTGLLAAVSNGRTTLSVDPTLVGMWSAVPATSSSPCAQGAWSVDSSFYYVCVATNTWRRAALASW